MSSNTLVSCLALLVVGCAAQSSNTSELAQKVGLCSRNTPDLNSCLTERLQVVYTNIMKNGLPELNLQPSDPAYVDALNVSAHRGLWNAEISTLNTKTYGVSEVKFHKVSAELDDPSLFRAKAYFTYPHILIEGDYVIDGNILGIHVNTSGIFNISMTDVTGAYDVYGVHFLQDGVDYVRIIRVDMLPEVGDMKVYASNLIPGNERLSRIVLDFFNRHWRIAYRILLPFTNEAWSKYKADAANKVFLQVPYNVLFPES